MSAGSATPAVNSFIRDRIQVNSLLIVWCFVSVLALSSQSAASYSTYILALAMVFSLPRWDDVFSVRLLWCIAALLVYLVASTLWSEPFVPRAALSVLIRAVLVFSFVVAFAECQLRGQMQRWLARAMAVSGSLATLAATIVFVMTNPADGRLNGLGQLHTHVVAALVFGAVLIFVLEVFLKDQSTAWRAFAVVSALMISTAVALSGSRNAWVSVLIGVGVLLLAHATPDRQRFVAGVSVMTVVVGVILGALAISETTHDALLPRGDSYRPEIWRATIDTVVDRGVWFGAGATSNDNVIVGEREFLHPHSMYLSVFFQGGIVAVVLFGTLLAGTLRTLLHHYTHPDAKLALGILGIALPAYVLDGSNIIDKVGSTWFLFWLPVAVAIGFRWSHRMPLGS